MVLKGAGERTEYGEQHSNFLAGFAYDSSISSIQTDLFFVESKVYLFEDFGQGDEISCPIRTSGSN